MSFGQQATPFPQCANTMQPSEVDAAIDRLIAKMTPEERIAELGDRAAGIERLGIPAYNWWNEGLHGVARNGYATVFPQAIGLAASWDTDLLHAVGETVSTEARARFDTALGKGTPRYGGVTFWSPNINIFRDPRWGRGQETYGEDPMLTAALGVAFVRGIQGDDPYYMRADATPKHFAVHSGPEEGRDGFNAVVSPRDLTDTYLKAFHALVTEGQSSAVMCSYNAINGVPACANAELLESRVRKLWKFPGYVVSDCDAVGNLSTLQHFAADAAHGAAAALHAGVDLDCGNSFNTLAQAQQEGLVAQGDIDAALHRLLAARLRLGMLQPPQCTAYNRIPATAINTPEHRALARRAAEESIVLLHNRGILPLEPTARIAIVGPTADSIKVLEANYHGTAIASVTPLTGLRRAFANTQYAQGSGLAEGVSLAIPETALRNEAKQPGLHVAWFANATLQGTPAAEADVRTVQLDIDRALPSPALHGDIYSARWTGAFVPPAAGDYVLRVAIERCWDCEAHAHDHFKLQIGDQILVNHGPGDLDRLRVHADDTSPKPLTLEFAHVGKDEGIFLEWEAPSETLLQEAVAAARNADVVVAFVGLSPDLEGEALPVKVPGFEGGDRTSLDLPSPQLALLQRLEDCGKPVIAVILSGSAVSLSPDRLAAVLEAWYPGEEGGSAIAEILSDKVSPSGKLPITFYRSADQLPAFRDYSMANRTYRYFQGDTLYAFGSGLSYTRFEVRGLKLSRKILSAGDDLTFSVTLHNQGSRSGAEVAEVYLTPLDPGLEPRIALVGFSRVMLKAGESRRVTVSIPAARLAITDQEGKSAIRTGKYRLFVGDSLPGKSQASASAVFRISSEKTLSY